MNKFENLTLIIPAKLESESLPTFLEEIRNYPNITIILQEDDKVTINSIEKFHNVKLHYQKVKGYGSAIIEGIENCNTKYFCIINADGSMDPKYLDKMYDECQNKDLVFGSRYIPEGGSFDDDFITLFGNKLFTGIANILYDLKISDILYTYVLGKTASFKNLNLSFFDFRLCVELPIKAKKKNYNYICLPSFERPRIGGKKKVNVLKDGFLILMAILSYLFTKNLK